MQPNRFQIQQSHNVPKLSHKSTLIDLNTYMCFTVVLEEDLLIHFHVSVVLIFKDIHSVHVGKKDKRDSSQRRKNTVECSSNFEKILFHVFLGLWFLNRTASLFPPGLFIKTVNIKKIFEDPHTEAILL